MRPRTIAIFLPTLGGGGAERNTLRLAYGLSQQGFPVDLVVAEKVGPFVSQVPEGVRLLDLKSNRVLFSLPKLVRYLRNEKPDVLLSVMDHANVVAIWARQIAGYPRRVVASVRNNLSSSSENATDWRNRYMPYFVRVSYPMANAIITVSQGVAGDLVRLVPTLRKKRVQVIYNPVVTPELLSQICAPCDHPWLNHDQPPVILAVGRLTKQKDLPTLIKAFSRVKAQRSARLLILGEGEERPSLRALVQQLGIEDSVDLPGFVENPIAYMARASLFVLSSAWEGLPTVLIEALAAGTPVVSTDCESGPREILGNGTYGELVPVGDVSALAEAMLRSLSKEHDREALRRRAMDFHVDAITKQYVRVLLGY